MENSKLQRIHKELAEEIEKEWRAIRRKNIEISRVQASKLLAAKLRGKINIKKKGERSWQEDLDLL